jgi:hypothetical protein
VTAHGTNKKQNGTSCRNLSTVFVLILAILTIHIMLRDELTLKCANFKIWFSVLDTPEHVDSEKLNRQIRYGPGSTDFFQNVIFSREHGVLRRL